MDTEKWSDPWYRKMPVVYKNFWDYLCARCDNAGVWKVDMELAQFQIGEPLKEAEALAIFEGKVVPLTANYWHIPGFVSFQFGELSADSKPHRSILSLIQKHQIKGYPKGIHTLKDSSKDSGKEKDKDKEGDGMEGVLKVIGHFNKTCKKALTLTKDRKSLIERRLAEGRTVDEMFRAIDNFSKDDWPERGKYMDLVYVIGIRNKIDNLDKWMNFQGGLNGISRNSTSGAYIGTQAPVGKYASVTENRKDSDINPNGSRS